MLSRRCVIMLTPIQQVLLTLSQMTSGASKPPGQVGQGRPATGSQRRAARRADAPTGVTKKPAMRAKAAATGAGGVKWMTPAGKQAEDVGMREMSDVRLMGGQQTRAADSAANSSGAAAAPLPTGSRVLHTGSDGRRREATITKSHTDDVTPYYTIRFADGGERDTDRQHLLPLPDAVPREPDADMPDAAGADDANVEGRAEAPAAAGAPVDATAAAATAATATAATAAGGEQQPQQRAPAKTAVQLPNLDAQFVATTSAIGPLRPNPKEGGRSLPPEPSHVVLVSALRALPGDELKKLPDGKACARPNKTLTVFEHNTGAQYSHDNGYSDPVTGKPRPFGAARSP